MNLKGLKLISRLLNENEDLELVRKIDTTDLRDGCDNMKSIGAILNKPKEKVRRG